MNNTIIFFSLLVLCLSAMLIFKIRLILDVNQNILLIVIRLYGLKIITMRVSLIGLYYQINNSKKKKTLAVFNKNDAYLIMQIKKSIIDKLYYDDIVLESSVGVASAKDTAILIGISNAICNYIHNQIYLNNSDTNFVYNNLPSFCQSKVYINLQIKVYFTIFDLGFALLLSFYKRGKYVKQTRQ